ncbi:MAG: hypothetical protein RM368_03910 [Nostoc sp. DedSLP03]|uniref:hypothetical protein n=1 Tax=Nostoc sp. DedSLP03 TaxID=3075400 RepID=UPI002AD1F5E4|nr:hypothetical protein [Nostoc sp. DedSLP03]MDZ7964112.1 hypothetical protein [Nostoc sp. DedSLP03]
MAPNWIFDSNLKPLIEILAMFCGCKIEQDDLDTIYSEVKKTDYEKDVWFKYEYSEGLELKVAQDLGSSVIFVDVLANEGLEAKVAVAIEILQIYRLI